MTAEDLEEGKIAKRKLLQKIIDPKTGEEKKNYQYEISKTELGLLILKYNRLYISKDEEKEKFEERVKKIVSSFDFADRNEGFENKEEMFLNQCLAICDENLSLAFFHGKNTVEKIIRIHDLVCSKITNQAEGSETIVEARKLDKMDVNIRRERKLYGEFKASYEYMLSCINDEEHFENFYKKLEGRMKKEDAREKIKENFLKPNGIKDMFLTQQSNYFDDFINFRLKIDVRLHNPANEKVI